MAGAGGAAGIDGVGGAAGVAGAGGADVSGSAGAGGSGVAGSAGSTGGSGSGGAGGSSACNGATRVDDSCSGDSDCVAVLHTTNCCGAAIWIGIRTTARSRFASLENACDASYPPCNCAPAPPPVAADGSVIPVGTTAGAECAAGVCKTFAPACGGSCDSGRSCLTCPTRSPKTTCSLRCMTDSDCTSGVYARCRLGPSGGICVPSNSTCTP
jgi:pilus assembly protein FimV